MRLPDQLERFEPQLRRLVLVNLGALSLATVGVGLAYLLTGGRLLGTNFLVLCLSLLVMLAGLATARRFGVPGFIVSLAVSVLVCAFGCVWVTPFLTPLAVLLVLLPLLAGYPYLPRRQMRLLLGYSLAAVATLAAVGSWRDRQGIGYVPPAAETVSLTLSIPTVLIVIAYSVNQTYFRLITQARELRQSRTRIADVADAARRSIERDLHDGAQQQLVRMSVLIGQVRSALERGDAQQSSRLLGELAKANTESLRELRELARGIYPPLLAERGLGPALQAACRRSALPVRLDVRDLPRQQQVVEAAVYFCIQEALANAAKHSGAQEVRVQVRANPVLTFTVADDGSGFRPGEVARPGGLLGMEARVKAAGGDLTVQSAPGRGTTVTGWFPYRRGSQAR